MHGTGLRNLLDKTGIGAMALAACALSFLFACGGNTDIEPWDYTVGVESAQELGALDFMGVVKARDGGFSAAWRDKSVWVFGDTILASAGEDGAAWRSSTMCRTDDMDASDGLDDMTDPVDSLGAPYEFLPFTTVEQAYNDDHRGDDCTAGDDCGARFALWPGPIVVLPDDTAVVMYTKLLALPGAFNFSVLGCGVATWAAPDQAVVRPSTGPVDAGDPTLLFGENEPCLTAAAIVHDGYLYAYAVQDAWMAQPCIVGRAPVADIQDRDAWLFYAGDDDWVADWKDAVKVIDGSTIMSIHFNEHLGRFVAVHNAIVSGDVEINVADNPWGPWSTPTVMFTGEPPDDTDMWNYSGLAHPEFAQDNGRIEYVTYYRPGDWTGEMRLVKVVFD